MGQNMKEEHILIKNINPTCPKEHAKKRRNNKKRDAILLEIKTKKT